MNYTKATLVAQAHLLDAIQASIQKLIIITDSWWFSSRQTTNAYEADE